MLEDKLQEALVRFFTLFPATKADDEAIASYHRVLSLEKLSDVIAALKHLLDITKSPFAPGLAEIKQAIAEVRQARVTEARLAKERRDRESWERAPLTQDIRDEITKASTANPDLAKIIEARTYDPKYTNVCQACFGSGWASSYKRCKITGIMTSYARPCDCDHGTTFIKSYCHAIERRTD